MQKSSFHPKNQFNKAYDFLKLAEVVPELAEFFKTTKSGHLTLNYNEPKAVKYLNKALLKLYYDIAYWDIPDDYLCPPIPGRLDYIHHLADLIEEQQVKTTRLYNSNAVVDIGTGPSVIFPILGVKEYNWSFLATDIDDKAIKVGQAIAMTNKSLQNRIKFRIQKDPNLIFKKVISTDQKFLASMCNPPFYIHEEQVQEVSSKKRKNLDYQDDVRNFGGKDHELITRGGEVGFISRMITESVFFKDNFLVFTSLVSQKTSLDPLFRKLERTEVPFSKVVTMKHGVKETRILAWSFR